MMMQHLYLHFSKNYEKYRRLPVLVHLKNFSGNDQDLDSFIFRSLQEFDLDLAFEDFRFELACGNCLLLLDGMDEIPTAVRGTFEKQLTTFTKMYRSPVVISSRPNSSFVNFVRFHVFEIEPFTKSKAIELIDKLDYHDLEAKKKFREDLEDLC